MQMAWSINTLNITHLCIISFIDVIIIIRIPSPPVWYNCGVLDINFWIEPSINAIPLMSVKICPFYVATSFGNSARDFCLYCNSIIIWEWTNWLNNTLLLLDAALVASLIAQHSYSNRDYLLLKYINFF